MSCWRIGALSLLSFAACFNPTFRDPACGPNGECPPGTSCVAGTCRANGGNGDGGPGDGDLDGNIDDATMMLVDARTCFGSGAFTVCLAAPPTSAVTVSGASLPTAGGMCLSARPPVWDATQPDACFIVGTQITVATASFSGSRPVVLVASDSITFTGTLEVASRNGIALGPGAPSSLCAGGTQGQASQNGGGGGGGGGFRTPGAPGGDGGLGTAGGSPGVNTAVPTILRAGCHGKAGGDGNGGGGGIAGLGGGAVYLVAGNTITLGAGAINASGSGGQHGVALTGGGGGGGSGGMIVLYAPVITSSSAKLMANGGGGASGAASINGNDGGDPVVAAPLSPAVGGAKQGDSGAGGKGYANSIAPTPGDASASASGGGGGGGGGAGYIRTNVTITGSATITPPADVVP